jgi:hypothetical protein
VKNPSSRSLSESEMKSFASWLAEATARQRQSPSPSESSISKERETISPVVERLRAECDQGAPKAQKTIRSIVKRDYYPRRTLPEGVKIDEKDRRLGEMLVWSISSSGHVVNEKDGDSHGLTLRLDRLIVMARLDQVVRHENGDLLDCRRANLIVEKA